MEAYYLSLQTTHIRQWICSLIYSLESFLHLFSLVIGSLKALYEL